ncbi:MAG TPA: anhydro-N-acetylmuramic acid kinase [Puia sp.]|jgi:anhydro-N-acetylmuramic acid kinase|nr:anhydro-N-acetylmuramic acid kinase [Puia sp.]
MIYKAIGIMSGSSLDGLDIAFVHLQENAGKWNFELIKAECYKYDEAWINKLQSAHSLNAFQYQLLHTEYGHYIGRQVNNFIEENDLHYNVQLIVSHGHTTFHSPEKKMTAQLGDGASIAAETGINTITDLRAIDVALGGQGAPIVPIGEMLLLGAHDFFLNLGGIANISFNNKEKFIAFDVCPANRVLNILANETGAEYDENGEMASTGKVNEELLSKLNVLEYYGNAYPKSLPNSFGTEIIFPLIKKAGCSIPDALGTYTEHIVIQIKNAIEELTPRSPLTTQHFLLTTGGGAHNNFLIERLQQTLRPLNITITIPEKNIIDFKEAIIMAFIGVLRWREENNVLASVTGAKRNSIGGAVWIGLEA